MRRFSCVSWFCLVLLAWAAPASAFTTRVHIVLANEVHASLVASGDGTLRLRWSDYSVQLPQEDADAIVAQPLAFRAGAIGPDNTVFPAMTDGTHGVEQDPYRQCQMLYDEAFTQAERAYALGCFLHGATDAVAHHFVNYYSGETFTLNPVRYSRASNFDNVIGHIATESLIQNALYQSDRARFQGTELDHSIPQDFVLRTYFDVESPLWQRMAEGALVKWQAAQAADPSGNVLSWAQSADFSPWEQIAMAPQYIEELQRLRGELRQYLVDRIAALAVDPSVDAQPGPDGVIGTPDDETACTVSCPSAFGEYWIYVRLLAPRRDTSGNPLPSAFDLISNDLGNDLYGFLPALVEVIANLSATLNTPIGDDGEHGLDIDRARLTQLFDPIDDWGARTFAIDWTSVGMAVSPGWYNDLSGFLSMFGVSVTLPDILGLLFQPIVDEIRAALIDEVRARAEEFVDELKAEYDARVGPWLVEVSGRVGGSSPPSLGESIFDRPYESGLFAYSFNLTAAAFANHEVLLVATAPIENGPASFDASYTPDWTQAGLCDYLRQAIFPAGLGVQPLLSVQIDSTFYGSTTTDNSPVECHDGSLETFGAPSLTSCAHTTLPELLVDPVGSLTRAFPPVHSAGNPACARLIVPGLPEPPPLPDGGMPGTDGGIAVAGDGGGGVTTAGGCCTIAPGARRGAPSGLWLLALLFGAALLRRRRPRAPAARTAACALLALSSLGCGDGVTPGQDGAMPDASETIDAAAPDAFVPDMDAGTDAGLPPGTDAGPDYRPAFLAELDGTVWSATQIRDEAGAGVERAYELHFQGGAEPMFGEIRNPYGPARQRVLRFMRIGRTACTDASRCDVETTVTIPDSTWETPPALRGQRETVTMEILAGSPRQLSIRNQSGVEEIFLEEPWPVPESGLTAEVRIFQGGSGHPISDAFCTTERSITNSMEQPTVWEFARGLSGEVTLGYDVVAGVDLGEWNDVANHFGIRDVAGFDIGTLGGSELTQQFYFVVRYTGVVEHPGGRFQMREQDDSVEDAVWAFVGAGVFGTSRDDLFLEVHHYVWPDYTSDDPSVTLAAGDVPVEIILPRCEMEFTGSGQVRAEARLGTGGYQLMADQPTRPRIDAALFPPVL